MNGKRGALWRTVLVALLVLGWTLSAHLASAGVGPADLHTVIALAPLIFAAMMLVWHSPLGVPGVAVVLAATAVALALSWAWLRGNVAWLYYLQHLGTHLALAVWFGRSLTGGREPVVTSMARMIFGDGISVRKRRYTRAVTWGWTLFLVLNAAVSTALFAWAPQDVWSVHANLLTGPLIACVFVIEMLVRRFVLPADERPSLQQVIRAYRARSATTADVSSADRLKR